MFLALVRTLPSDPEIQALRPLQRSCSLREEGIGPISLCGAFSECAKDRGSQSGGCRAAYLRGPGPWSWGLPEKLPVILLTSQPPKDPKGSISPGDGSRMSRRLLGSELGGTRVDPDAVFTKHRASDLKKFCCPLQRMGVQPMEMTGVENTPRHHTDSTSAPATTSPIGPCSSKLGHVPKVEDGFQRLLRRPHRDEL